MTKTQSVLVTNVVSFIALCTESNRQNYVAFNHDNLAVWTLSKILTLIAFKTAKTP